MNKKEILPGQTCCTFRAFIRKHLIINGAGEENQTFVS
jgi:hypothetical protein